ncbi:MAG: hypothetical protein ACYSWQ_04295 [Planctomycetota bacterium]|jgi:hypothetical protein
MTRKEQEQLKLPLECYRSGELIIPTMEEAINEVCRTDHGNIATLNRIIWNVAGHRGWNDAYEIGGERPTEFGLRTYASHGQPFTIDDAEVQINGKKELSHNLFIAWASRFNSAFYKDVKGDSLPRKYWPLRNIKVAFNGNGRLMRLAYQMRDDHTPFVVMGVDRDQVDASIVPNWSMFWREFLNRWSNEKSG